LTVRSATRRLEPAPLAITLLCGALLSSALGACGVKDFENENDRLRRLTLEQEGLIRALRAESSEYKAKLAEANLAREAALDPDILEAIPRCAGIGIDELSGLHLPRPGEDVIPKVVIYVDPFDGRDRFIQIVGTLTVDAIIAGATGDAAPLIVSTTLGPADVRDAYRAAVLTGYYYLVELPVEASAIPPEGTVTLRARFADALTGEAHDAEATSRIRTPD
jgi:hypothetical protein